MKKWFQSYTSFSHTEWMGLVALCSLIAILLVVRFSMSVWVKPEIDTMEEKKLVAAWEKYKLSQPAYQTADNEEIDDIDAYQDANDDSPYPMPTKININTADSATLVRLKGIGPKTAHKIIIYRNTNGAFTTIEQFKHLCTMPPATFEVLEKHLIINNLCTQETMKNVRK